MMQYPEPIAKLIDSYMKLPGIGEKTATRLAFFTIDMQQEDVVGFSKALLAAKRDLRYCSICGNITESDPCVICADKARDQAKIIVVEQPKDVMSLERMREYHGLYHVLHGVLSPMEGKVLRILTLPVCYVACSIILKSTKSLLQPMLRLKVRQLQCIFHA